MILFYYKSNCNDLETENEWKKEWSEESIWNYGANLSKGVRILFDRINAIDVVAKKIMKTKSNINQLEINGHKIQIFNIYAPNNSVHRKRFYNNLNTYMANEYCHILGGILIVQGTIKLIVTHKIIAKIKVIKS